MTSSSTSARVTARPRSACWAPGVPDSRDWDPHYARLRLGWERYMARMKVTLESPPKPKKAPPPEEPKDPPLRYLDY